MVPADSKEISQLDWCLSHPPASGKLTSEFRDIQIDRAIRVGDDCGAQILLLREGLVAKIYDPLHYKFMMDPDPCFRYDEQESEKCDVAAMADTEYSAEVAAYRELCGTPFAGDITSMYHGSWSLTLPIRHTRGHSKREVRMILIEYISGLSMHSVNPRDLTAEQREQIMFKVIEAEADLEYIGIEHEDLEPRNIMLSTRGALALSDGSNPPIDATLRVCVIDLARSTVFRLAEVDATPRQRQNPIFSWVGQDYWSHWGWLSPHKEDVEWMWRTWGDGGKDGKYVPAERNPESKLDYPIRLAVLAMYSNSWHFEKAWG